MSEWIYAGIAIMLWVMSLIAFNKFMWSIEAIDVFLITALCIFWPIGLPVVVVYSACHAVAWIVREIF